MSGYSLVGFGTGRTFEKSIISENISMYQYESIQMGACEDIKGFNNEKVLTPAQLKKLTSSYPGDIVLKYVPDGDKYELSGVRLGITRFVKYKAEYQPERMIQSVPKRVGVTQKGYTVVTRGGNYKAATLTDAKKLAQELLMGTKQISAIYKNYIKDGYILDKVKVGIMSFKEVGEMKSRPSKPPKSYIVLPEYLYAYDGCCVDAEYEYM